MVFFKTNLGSLTLIMRSENAFYHWQVKEFMAYIFSPWRAILDRLLLHKRGEGSTTNLLWITIVESLYGSIFRVHKKKLHVGYNRFLTNVYTTRGKFTPQKQLFCVEPKGTYNMYLEKVYHGDVNIMFAFLRGNASYIYVMTFLNP